MVVGLESALLFLLHTFFFTITEESTLQPVYAYELEDHLRIYEREIAFVIEECIAFLNEYGLDVEVGAVLDFVGYF